ncbi:hypothetical protein Patl1_32192 [Pistacia atlantica]|uniref:Uncharacterized protein n=1 Tax=Pistacia atlantica TaxID=434234 RepID=A0ACC1AQ18_9ROSI|nr:hypothetical protein Patl1_32192 [Pistacia atlantica]
MGRAPCCDKANVKKGPWSPEEDAKLKEYIEKHGTGSNWIALPQKAAQLPGRTDNDIKNYWNTKLKKKLMSMANQSQRKLLHHQAATFSSLLQTSSSPSTSPSPQLSSPSSTISYTNNNTYYTTQATTFSSLDPPNSFSNTQLGNNSCITAGSNILQVPQESTLLSPIQHYQVKDSGLMFGGDQAAASCRPSDATKELDYDYGGRGNGNTDQMGLQNCFYISDGGGCGYSTHEQKPNVNGGWDETPLLDYGFEEIKQLISTSSCNNNSILFDEKKTEEKVMYY